MNLEREENIEIILVDLNVFQSYILHNISHLHEIGYNRITVITTRNIQKYFIFEDVNLILSEELEDYYIEKKLNDFYVNCGKRFFYIFSYMKKYDRQKCLHIENDVLLYQQLDNISDHIYLTMDSEQRCIPGVVYIPEYKLLQDLIDKYDYMQNDMINLAHFYNNNRDTVKSFPISTTKWSDNFERFGMIFDAAAIGQYLFGIDPKNTTQKHTEGFINETCVVKYNKYIFVWKYFNGMYRPYIIINDQLIPIFNLHIHSKRLHLLVNEKRIVNRYISKILEI